MVTLLADMQVQLIAKSTGLDYIWQWVLAYYLSFRAQLNVLVAMNYGYLTRELVLNKGYIQFIRKGDAANLDDAIAIGTSLIVKACDISPRKIEECNRAAAGLRKLTHDFEEIKNATKAFLIVSTEKCKFFYIYFV